MCSRCGPTDYCPVCGQVIEIITHDFERLPREEWVLRTDPNGIEWWDTWKRIDFEHVQFKYHETWPDGIRQECSGSGKEVTE